MTPEDGAVSCDLCNRREVTCKYLARYNKEEGAYAQVPAEWTHDGADASLSESHSHNHEHEQRSSVTPSSGEIDANAIHFIAPYVFQQARLELPRPNLPVPHDVSALIGDASSIRSIAATFYMDIHRWLPIVSKRGFFTYLLNPLTQRRTELSLLTLCMRLCCSAPSPDANGDGGSSSRLPLYRIAKRYHHEAETAGVQSIYVLQAGILIALYELGQAIYPAAYLTVGACARYGLALGIDKLSLTPVGDMDAYSWNKVEEKRRLWWAVIMFDRFLSLSNPTRPLSTEDPTFDTYLPVDDAAWDDCVRLGSS
ncbi:hypothetical protein SLS62_007747 [Diatrype stigma]|uniref:Xylanolytic transcriptional activator regulatory domain-containing protein n=1 Tax=Diatrype stigma TaxID=117547 RepID=A0AAN9UL04_9PEZI